MTTSGWHRFEPVQPANPNPKPFQPGHKAGHNQAHRAGENLAGGQASTAKPCAGQPPEKTSPKAERTAGPARDNDLVRDGWISFRELSQMYGVQPLARDSSRVITASAGRINALAGQATASSPLPRPLPGAARPSGGTGFQPVLHSLRSCATTAAPPPAKF